MFLLVWYHCAMVAVNGLSDFPAFSVRKKTGRSAQYGFRRFGHGRYGHPSLLAGVYQRRHGPNGTYTVRMRYSRPTDPSAPAVLANRAKFAAAMSSWGGLTDEQRAAYNVRAKRRGMFGWGLYIREFYQENP